MKENILNYIKDDISALFFTMRNDTSRDDTYVYGHMEYYFGHLMANFSILDELDHFMWIETWNQFEDFIKRCKEEMETLCNRIRK